ncbi:Gfo/Idh/MocA family oxidoreductase [Thermostilla marina]
MAERSFSRRRFLARGAAAGVVAAMPLPHIRAQRYAAAERLNVALIGVSGRGGWFVDAIPHIGENVVAMCDVNDRRAAGAFAKIPQAKQFRDFRRMFDAMADAIDAVVVAVPDHNHAVIANTAIVLEKHVYCEKPLTHHVHEARHLRANARKYGVATQMGNQGTATHAFREGVEIVQSGMIGTVREVYVWKDSGGPGFPPVPTGGQPVPEYLDWDVWLGPASDRSFDERWLKWHTWRDFGTGNLGNWGSHSTNMAFMALRVDRLWDAEAFPKRESRIIKVVAEVDARTETSFPRWERVRWFVPARGDLPPVVFDWFNGARAPGRREHIESILGQKLDWGDAGERRWADHGGCLIRGEKGLLKATAHNSEYVLLPEDRFAEVKLPKPYLPRSGSHEREWTTACKGGPMPMSHFDYASRLIEFLMLGNVATLFPEEELEYDPVEGAICNHPAGDAALHREYRKGWSLA